MWEIEHREAYESKSGQNTRKQHELNPRIALPNSWIDPPKLPRQVEWIGRAFIDLCSERYIGMDIGQIQFSKIVSYARYYGFDRRRTEKLIRYIQAIDGAYLKWLKSKTPEKQQDGNAQQFSKSGKNTGKVRK